MISLKYIHLIIGFIALFIFILTGQYMKSHFPDAYQSNEIIRYTYRANHIYIFFSSVIHIILGIYLSTPHRRWQWILQIMGSILLIISLILLILAFYYEAPVVTPYRSLSYYGVISILAGVTFHLPSLFRK